MQEVRPNYSISGIRHDEGPSECSPQSQADGDVFRSVGVDWGVVDGVQFVGRWLVVATTRRWNYRYVGAGIDEEFNSGTGVRYD